MDVYQSFLKFTSEVRQNPSDYYEWETFASDFASEVCRDKHLQNLVSKYPILNDHWSEIENELGDNVDEGLLYFGYAYVYSWLQDIWDVDKLADSVLMITENELRGVLVKSFLGEKIISPENFYKNEYGPEEWSVFQLENEEIQEGDESNIFDKTINEEINKVITDLRKVTVDKLALLNYLKSWNSLSKSPKIIKRIPIIKIVDHIDPSIYALLSKQPDLLNTLDWRIFEELLADILKTFGYSIELTRKTKDGGIDVIAIKSDLNFGLHKYILQAKRYMNKPVQVSPVRELLFLHNEQKATKSCLATTSAFTKGAWQLANKYRWTLELKDKTDLLDWIQRANEIKNKLK